MSSQGNRVTYKHGVVGNSPIIAFQVEPELWLLVGGTYKVKDKLESAGCKFAYERYSHVFSGAELAPSVEALVDYIHPLKGIQDEDEQQQGGSFEMGNKDYRFKTYYRRPKADKRQWMQNFKEPKKIADFVPPSWFDDYLFYLANPEVYPVVAIVGPTGNGKTTGAIAAQDALGINYVVIDITEFIEPADLIGAMTYHPEHGEVWMDGSVSAAFRNGYNVVINEFDSANPRAALCLQSALQDSGKNGMGRYVTTPGCPDHDRIYPKGPCTITVTMNTYGTGASRMYTGRNTIDQATLDRMAFIPTSYEHEEEILMARGYKRKTANILMKWATTMRKKIDENALKLNVSPRTMSRMAHYMEQRGATLEDAAEKQFLSRVDIEDRELLA